MEWVETTARTVADAKEIALDRLGVAADDAEFEVLEEPRAGLFGRLRGEARVRARVKPTPVRPKQERRRRGRAAGRTDDNGGADSTTDGSTDAESAKQPRSARGAPRRSASSDEATPETTSSRRPARRSARDDDAEQDPQQDTADSQASGADAPKGGGARRRGGRGRGGAGATTPVTTRGDDTGRDAADRDGAERTDADDQYDDGAAPSDSPDAARSASGPAAEPAPRTPAPSNQEKSMDNEPNDELVSPDEVGAAAVAFVDGLVQAFGAAGTTSLAIDGSELEVTVNGEELGRLVGPGGRTLLAVQDLARVAAQRKLGDHDTRLRVDVGGYRQRRQVALERFARSVAETVRATGEARSLEPMASADRKIVHDVLNDEPGVSSRSEGEDPNRRVVVVPE